MKRNRSCGERSFPPATPSRTLFATCLALSLIGFANSAQAALLTGNYSGTVTFVPTELSSEFSVGDTISGTYTFESTTAARAGSTMNFAAFDALTSASYTVGSYTATSAAAPEIQVDDVMNADRYGIVSRASEGLTGADVNGYSLSFASFRLDDSTGTAINNALILPTMLDFNDFDSSGFFITFGSVQNGFYTVSGELDSFEITDPSAVPEPSTLILASLGGVGLIAFGIRRRKQAGRK